MTTPRIHFVASQVKPAGDAAQVMKSRYGQSALDEAEVIVALGGDGFMLRTLHRVIERKLPVFGMKIGNIGFLMNRYSEDDLEDRLAAAHAVNLNPLRMIVQTESGTETSALAINEISLLRQTNQAAHIRILINGAVKVPLVVIFIFLSPSMLFNVLKKSIMFFRTNGSPPVIRIFSIPIFTKI